MAVNTINDGNEKMSTKNPFTVWLILMIAITWLIGCARFATSDKKIAALEEKVSVGMTEKAFTTSIPNAQLLGTTGDRSAYVVLVTPPCFVCGSVASFTRSYELYATRFIFEKGELVSFERLLNGE